MTTVSQEAGTDPWVANDATFGARLALIRQRMGWGNVKEAAIRCGIPAQSWRTWERDGVMPQGSRYFAICAQIAAVVGCDYGWLVDRRPSKTVKPSAPKVSRKLRSIAGSGTVATLNRPLIGVVTSPHRVSL